MNDRDTLGIGSHTDFERISVRRGSDEHGHIWIVGLEGSPVMSNCMLHVVFRDTVLAGARLDVDFRTLPAINRIVNTC
jgi:hypothetical protein